ncbi:MAG TPA: prolyl oligopeptidase family serine peptidase, partial [bacterium]
MKSNLQPFKGKAVVLLLAVSSALLLLFIPCPESSAQESVKITSPQTRTETVTDTLHGVVIADPYRWLEDQDSPETRAWINAQNQYAHSRIDSLPVRKAIVRRLTELMRIDRIEMPIERSGRYFFKKQSVDQEQGVLCMRQGPRGGDDVLVDPNALSPGHTVSAYLEDVSMDGAVMAYSIQQGGEDETVVKLFNADAKTHLPDSLKKARYFGVALLPDKSGLYYSRHGEEGSRVYYHAMGSAPESDPLVFGEGYGPEKGIGVGLSDDGRYLLITVFHGSSGDKTEIYFQDLVKKGPIVTVVNDLDARFEGAIGGNTLFLLTNWNAPKGRMLTVDLANPARETWREIIPESDAALDGFFLAGGKVLTHYLKNVVSQVIVFEPTGKRVRDIPLPALGSIDGISGRWASDVWFFDFTSFHMPTTLYRNSLASGTQEVWARQNVPIRSDLFDVKQVWYRSKDNTKVPMFVVHKKGLKRNGSNPTYLMGYGGFMISQSPYFSSTIALWIENGGVFALPSLRGGGEFGEEWHKAGMQEKKQNVFDDFLAAGEWLIANKYTNSSRLAIEGGSNGGLLVAACMIQRPDLFGAVVAQVPVTDMLRYHKFTI